MAEALYVEVHNAAVWVFFSSIFTKIISQSQLCLYLFIGKFELQVSASYGHYHAPLKDMNIETLLSKKGKAFLFTVG
jgi:hypothetical protein